MEGDSDYLIHNQSSDFSPLIQDCPFQSRLSQNHQHCYIGNPRLESNDLWSPMNLPKNQGFGFGWENFESNNFFADMDGGYLDLLEAQLQRMRIDAAASVQLITRNRQISGFRNNYPNVPIYNGIRIGSDHDQYYGRTSMKYSNSSLAFTWNSEHLLQNFPSLQDLKGHVVSVAKDQYGCRFLLKKLEEGNPVEIELILWEVMGHLHHLMVDHFGNYVIQKIFEASSVEQMAVIVDLIIQDEQKLKEVCIHNHGTRAIQNLVEHLRTPDQITAVILGLKRISVTLSKSVNGGYVIQQCLKLFSPSLSKLILDEVAENCADIATDKSGCSIMQRCLGLAKGEAMRRLVEAIVSYALILAQDPYGNYVVQYVVKMKIPQINAAMILQLLGKYDQLSMNKHASNVVEDLLEFCEERDAAIIIGEIMHSPNFLNVLQDPYGNYVAQRALKNAKGALRKALSNSIVSNYVYLHSHMYGKRVLAFAKGCRIRV